jgi:hypothetical protein
MKQQSRFEAIPHKTSASDLQDIYGHGPMHHTHSWFLTEKTLPARQWVRNRPTGQYGETDAPGDVTDETSPVHAKRLLEDSG